MENAMPVHVRARWIPRKRRSLLFGAAYLSYDVRFANGEVELDVNIDDVLQGARYPADYHATISGAKAVAGSAGPGEWVDYPYGRPLPGGNLGSMPAGIPEVMSRFAFILGVMGLQELGGKYAALAGKLRTDASPRAVAEAREWVLGSFGRGSGSLSDRYVYRDGAFDEGLNTEYETLLQRLTDFAHDTGTGADGQGRRETPPA